MTVGRDFGVHIKVIEQHEFARQRVLIRRDFIREQTQVRIAIAFGQMDYQKMLGLNDFNRLSVQTAPDDQMINCQSVQVTECTNSNEAWGLKMVLHRACVVSPANDAHGLIDPPVPKRRVGSRWNEAWG